MTLWPIGLKYEGISGCYYGEYKLRFWGQGYTKPGKYLSGWVDGWLGGWVAGLAGNITIWAQLKLESGLSLTKILMPVLYRTLS